MGLLLVAGALPSAGILAAPVSASPVEQPFSTAFSTASSDILVDPDPLDGLAEGDIRARMQDEAITREEAVRRFAVEDATVALQAEVDRTPKLASGSTIFRSL